MEKWPWWLVPIKNNRESVTLKLNLRHPGSWRAYAIAVWYDILNRAFPAKCGYGCEWVYPYGWVPEAWCPEHD